MLFGRHSFYRYLWMQYGHQAKMYESESRACRPDEGFKLLQSGQHPASAELALKARQEFIFVLWLR
jgi:hypothetical protein